MTRRWSLAPSRPGPQHPVRVAIVGIGSMGKGLAYQAEISPEFHCAALADIRIDRAIACAAFLKREYRVVHTADEAADAMRASCLAIAEDGAMLSAAPGFDVLVESSSSITAGGQHAEAALTTGRHVVMMNAESDLVFGPYLMRLARAHGVVYTSTDGDQPGVIARLVDELERWGFELVMAGNMKGFLDRYSNPTKIIPEADKRNIDYKMASSYTDGSKLCVEMALVANAMGLRTLVPGMVGPRVTNVGDVLGQFDFAAIRESGPVVDYVLGAQPDGGVFAVGYCDHPYQRDMLKMLKMGTGPFYVFYRPYHLCHVEALAAATLAMSGASLLEPRHGFLTDVIAYAKTDLQAGQTLDGFGGYAMYGLLENIDAAADPAGLPLCLAEDVTLRRDVPKDARLTVADIRYDPTSAAFAMFAKAREASALLP